MSAILTGELGNLFLCPRDNIFIYIYISMVIMLECNLLNGKYCVAKNSLRWNFRELYFLPLVRLRLQHLKGIIAHWNFDAFKIHFI